MPRGDLRPGSWGEATYSILVLNRYDGPTGLPLAVVLGEIHADATAREPLAVTLGEAGPRIAAQVIEAQEASVTGAGLPPELRNEVDELPPAGKPNPDAWAVVVGIERYGAKVPVATYARRDATVFREYLTRILGIPPRNTVLLTDGQATSATLRKELGSRLRDRIRPGVSDVYVFFAGHGAPDAASRSAYLVPQDGDPDYPQETCLPVGEIYRGLGQAGARSVTVFLDACFSGASGRGAQLAGLARGTRPIATVPILPDVPEPVSVLSAAGAGETSSSAEDRRHGLFSYFVMMGLRGRADADGDGRITLGELADYVAVQVKQEAQAMGRKQNPELTGGDRARVLVMLK